MRLVLSRLALPALLLPLVLAACGDDPAGPEPEANTILALVTNTDDLNRLEALVRNTEFETMLQSRQGLTLFAPTNLALERLGPDMLTRLSGDTAVLSKILRRHIVPQPVRVADLRDGDTLTPLEGPPLVVRVEDGQVFVGEARLTPRRSDFETGTGIVHYLDDVVRDHLTLAERLRITPLAFDFANTLNRADLSGLLDDGEPYTLLAPIDNAFDLYGVENMQELVRFENRPVLQKIMRHHILPGRVRIEDLLAADELTPLDGSPLPVEEENGVIYLGGARVIAAEVEASDGLLYLLDGIVLDHLNLADRIQIAPNLNTYQAVLAGAGVLDALRGEAGPHTVFLPMDPALEQQLGTPFVPALEARPDLLLRTAQYAVVPGRVEPESFLTQEPLTTLGGYTLPVTARTTSSGIEAFVGERGRVAFPPLETANGLLYTIAPFVYPPNLDLEEMAVFMRLYRFLELMREAGLTDLLQGSEPYTLFAPGNQALEGVSIPGGELPEVLRGYIVQGRYAYEDVAPGIVLETLAGTTIEIENVPDAGLFANGVSLGAYSDRPLNGVIYTLEALLP